MTDAEKGAAWRSLPEDFKRQLRCDYTTAAHARSIDLTEVRIETREKFLELYFGKHNLTATEEEKPRFSKGDKVLYVGENQAYTNSIWKVDGEVFYNDYYKCDMVSSLFDGDTHICNVPLSDLTPYTGQEPPLKATAAESLIQMAKDEMGIVNNDTSKSGTPDWLAYRMELAKEITPKVICAVSDNGVSSDFCESVINKVATIVDGIVERLKGGLK